MIFWTIKNVQYIGHHGILHINTISEAKCYDSDFLYVLVRQVRAPSFFAKAIIANCFFNGAYNYTRWIENLHEMEHHTSSILPVLHNISPSVFVVVKRPESMKIIVHVEPFDCQSQT